MPPGDATASAPGDDDSETVGVGCELTSSGWGNGELIVEFRAAEQAVKNNAAKTPNVRKSRFFITGLVYLRLRLLQWTSLQC